MRKFFIECHWDGDGEASWGETVEAADQDTAEGEALLRMAVDNDRISETDGGYDGPENEGMTRDEAIEEARNWGYIDSCTEVLAESFANHSPLALLFHELDELKAGNSDLASVYAAQAVAEDWWTSRSDVF